MKCTKNLCCSPCVVQVPDPPPHRLRCPVDLAWEEVYCQLKAGCRLNWQNLQRHHHCRHPEEEDGQRDVRRLLHPRLLRTLEVLIFSRLGSEVVAQHNVAQNYGVILRPSIKKVC